MEEQLVLFELSGETYGVNVAQVQSIIPKQGAIPVPGAPAFIEGVINLRGTVVPVVDLRSRFDLAPPENVHKPAIIITEVDGLQLGLVVDRVTDVAKISEETIEPPSPLLVNIDAAFLRGIGRFKDELVILLDLSRVFSADEQQALLQTA